MMPTGVYSRGSFDDRFWCKVKKLGINDCWEWTASKDNKGYGEINVEGKTQKAHRISYKLTFNDPNEFHVLHKCDNPSCVNPSHLFLGTNADNMNDKIAKNRQAKGHGHGLCGDKSPMAKFTKQQILEIKEKLNCGVSGTELSKKYGVTKTTISNIKNNKTYKE